MFEDMLKKMMHVNRKVVGGVMNGLAGLKIQEIMERSFDIRCLESINLPNSGGHNYHGFQNVSMMALSVRLRVTQQ